MLKRVLLIVLPFIIIILILSSLGEEDTNYSKSIGEKRAEKVHFLKTSSSSPFIEKKKKFAGLDFYPIDTKYKVRANLRKLPSSPPITVKNSDGSSTPYLKYAVAEFKLDGQDLALTILKPAGFGTMPNSYFTGFADETSGSETYGGGRYLDLEIGKSENMTIDFNLAYNPYCAYAEGYTCPLPPKENVLPVKILAGEKDYTANW